MNEPVDCNNNFEANLILSNEVLSLKKQDNTEDKIKIGDTEYTAGATDTGEQYLIKFDQEAQKEIKIVFSNEGTDGISDKVIQALSRQYINRILNPK